MYEKLQKEKKCLLEKKELSAGTTFNNIYCSVVELEQHIYATALLELSLESLHFCCATFAKQRLASTLRGDKGRTERESKAT